jgi:hypothetical protein
MGISIEIEGSFRRDVQWVDSISREVPTIHMSKTRLLGFDICFKLNFSRRKVAPFHLLRRRRTQCIGAAVWDYTKWTLSCWVLAVVLVCIRKKGRGDSTFHITRVFPMLIRWDIPENLPVRDFKKLFDWGRNILLQCSQQTPNDQCSILFGIQFFYGRFFAFLPEFLSGESTLPSQDFGTTDLQLTDRLLSFCGGYYSGIVIMSSLMMRSRLQSAAPGAMASRSSSRSC